MSIDLPKPILAEMRDRGASQLSARAWLALTRVEQDGGVRVVQTNGDRPMELAGLKPCDRIGNIDGTRVNGLEAINKTLWHRDKP